MTEQNFPAYAQDIAALLKQHATPTQIPARFMAAMVTYVAYVAKNDALTHTSQEMSHDRDLKNGNRGTPEFVDIRNEKRFQKQESRASKKGLDKVEVNDEIDRFLRDQCGVKALERPGMIKAITKKLRAFAHENSVEITAQHVPANFAKAYKRDDTPVAL